MKTTLYFSITVLLVCAAIIAAPGHCYAQDAKPSSEQRIAKLEKLVQQLQQRIAQLEARLGDVPTKKQPIAVSKGDWHDKSNWRKLRKGMAEDDVSTLLGQPEKVDAGTYTIYWHWNYPSGTKVMFDAKSGLVEGWTEP